MKYGFVSIFLLLVFTGEGWSQNYRPLPGAGSLWQFVEYNTGSLNPAYWSYYYLNVPVVDPDTTISTTTYHKIIKSTQLQTDYFGCYRSENTGKTWFIPAQDSVEQLIINFNVQPGDTLFDIYISNRFQNSNPQYVVIDSIGVFQSGVTSLKMVFASYETGFLYREPLLWIESFGSMQGFTNQVHDGWSTWIPLCVSSDDSVRYQQQCNQCYFDSTFMQPRSFAPQYGVCQGNALVITGQEEASEQAQLNFYPNPASTSLTLEPPTNEPQQFRMYTTSGQLVLNQRIQGRSTIDVSHLPEGIYLLELETPQGIVHQKLVLQR